MPCCFRQLNLAVAKKNLDKTLKQNCWKWKGHPIPLFVSATRLFCESLIAESQYFFSPPSDKQDRAASPGGPCPRRRRRLQGDLQPRPGTRGDRGQRGCRQTGQRRSCGVLFLVQVICDTVPFEVCAQYSGYYFTFTYGMYFSLLGFDPW